MKMMRRRRMRNPSAPGTFAQRETMQAALFNERAPGRNQNLSQPAMVVVAGLSFQHFFCPRRTRLSDRCRRHVAKMLTKS
jgi:hypothetical protein